MASDYDATEFVDGDFQRQNGPYGAPAGQMAARAPSREEVDAKVSQAQVKLAELKRAQEELERERTALEETRRRQMELQTGRAEMIQNLTRGLGLLEEAEFGCRRDAEQMAKALVDLREALAKVQMIHEEGWTKDNFSVQLTQALTTLENARMEWNSARLKFPALCGTASAEGAAAETQIHAGALLSDKNFGDMWRYGLALTWPVAVAVLVVGALFAILLLSR